MPKTSNKPANKRSYNACLILITLFLLAGLIVDIAISIKGAA